MTGEQAAMIAGIIMFGVDKPLAGWFLFWLGVFWWLLNLKEPK
jgi:hypothetical protein